MKPISEINKMIDRCDESDLTGMTYEEGVKTALEWVSEQSDEEPIED